MDDRKMHVAQLQFHIFRFTAFSACFLLPSPQISAAPANTVAIDKPDLILMNKVNESTGGAPSNLYHGKKIYRQNNGIDPFAWAFSGPAIDQAAAQMYRSYYGNYGFSGAPRNYIYYDWGW